MHDTLIGNQFVKAIACVWRPASVVQEGQGKRWFPVAESPTSVRAQGHVATREFRRNFQPMFALSLKRLKHFEEPAG